MIHDQNLFYLFIILIIFFLQPIWTDKGEEQSVKTLSKFPSFFPERVSPRLLTNQRLSSTTSKPSPNQDYSDSEPDNNSCSINMSSSDSDTEEIEVINVAITI